ncbi:MAG: hypothetical protein AAGH19_05550 [Pseudomonadota bacterium]
MSKPLVIQQASFLRLVAAFGLLCLLPWLAGCAGTARGVERSVYQASPALSAPTAPPALDSSAQVVIRYPAMIHAEAESLYVSSFAVQAIGGTVPYTQFAKPQTARIAQSVISKSSFYAMTLYRELQERLPPGRVLLSPHIILWSEARGLHSRPILASEQVPAVLTIDFSVYSFPDVNEMMDEPPVTFGDLVTPLVVVKSSRWARPALNGLLLSSDPLLGAASRQAEDEVTQQLAERLGGVPETVDDSLEFIAFLAERDAPSLTMPTRAPGSRASSRVAIEAYPVEKIQMDPELVALIETGSVRDPFADNFAEGAADRVLELLNDIDHERATFFARQSALARFDPELASVFFLQSEDESVRARLQLADALLAAEREFLAAQSDSIYAGTYTGDFGVRMRKIIAAEYRMLEERRRLARRQNVTTAVAALALAGSVYGATVTTTASAAAVATFSGVSLLGSMWALNQSLDARSESEEVSEYFIARMAPTFERQMSVQTEWLESKELITARGFAEFRNKTLTLYQSRVRSLAVSSADRCRFRHPDIDDRGRWYGECRAGEAVGRGYGVVGDAAGALVEYVGEARDGSANGTGAMIVRTPGQPGATYYEGRFLDGLPDGSVRVEAPGVAPRWRLYAAGTDQGRAEPGTLNSFGFIGDATATRVLNP